MRHRSGRTRANSNLRAMHPYGRSGRTPAERRSRREMNALISDRAWALLEGPFGRGPEAVGMPRTIPCNCNNTTDLFSEDPLGDKVIKPRNSTANTCYNFTDEDSGLRKWLRENGTDPMTRQNVREYDICALNTNAEPALIASQRKRRKSNSSRRKSSRRKSNRRNSSRRKSNRRKSSRRNSNHL